ncbi:hypothetical protein [Microcoleus sp. FACHB-672]|uniref:hypothetical protein n=1 Tax=Microcoleus sp. FACHB-672 TaxID=2692825 RepID=UPI001685861E|nr:hypothetical protein [Microcoleus sp. FACHB-672]MBD2040517.1 hypothetical protein [Microcoleus sp. FACHB-672]
MSKPIGCQVVFEPNILALGENRLAKSATTKALLNLPPRAAICSTLKLQRQPAKSFRG